MKKTIICTVCPNGCEVVAEYTSRDDVKLSGNRCRRGIEYCINECFDPKRTFTSSVAITGAARRRMPVRTTAPISKDLLFACAEELKKIALEAPVVCGQTVAANILGTGVDLVACMTLDKKEN
jgi:CxxC motif-containing protein